MRRDWFDKVRKEFSRIVSRFNGQKIVYVEVGVWFGDSAKWTMDNIVAPGGGFGFGIDPYADDNRKLSQHRLQEIQHEARQLLMPHEAAERWSWIYERSQVALRRWIGPIDLLYLDGSHHAQDVLMDFCYAWPHLKVGSVVIFDDYGIGRRKEKEGVPHVPTACDAIMSCFKLFVNPISQGMQFALEVTGHPEPGSMIRVVDYGAKPICVGD